MPNIHTLNAEKINFTPIASISFYYICQILVFLHRNFMRIRAKKYQSNKQ